MIKLNDTIVKELGDFSSEFQLVLSVIDDGQAWLTWAIGDSTVNYQVVSENEFLLQIQSGLHVTKMISSTTVRMGLEKILTLDSEDIISIFGENNGNTSDTQLEGILTKYQLVSFQKLEIVDKFLLENKVQESPILQAPSFTEQLALFNTISATTAPTKLQTEAIDFAATTASSVQELCDLFLFYLHCSTHQMGKETASTKRKQKVKEVYNTLSTLTNFLIYVPNVGIISNNDKLQEYITNFKTIYPSFIGYKTKAAAMYNLVQNIKILDKEEAVIKADIEKYLLDVKSAFATSTIPSLDVSQDGCARTISIDTPEYKLRLVVDQQGDLCLLPDTLRNATN